MSLINQMLKELEQHQKPADRALSREVHAVDDPVKTHRFPRLIAAVVALAAVIGGGYYFGSHWKAARHPVAKQLPDVHVLPPLPVSQPAAVPVSPVKTPEAAKQEPARPSPVQHAKVNSRENEPALPKEKTVAKKIQPKPVAKLVKEVSPAEQSEYHYQQALGLLQQGRLAEAESNLRAALRFDPDHALARRMLAGLMIEQKRYGEAQDELQAGLQLDPGRTDFSTALARLQVESGDNRSALDTLKRALPHAGNDAGFYGFYAVLLQRAGQHADAVHYFGMALKLVPSDGKWWVGMGISLEKKGRMQEAMSAFTHALSIKNLNPELRAFSDQQIRAIKKTDKP